MQLKQTKLYLATVHICILGQSLQEQTINCGNFFSTKQIDYILSLGGLTRPVIGWFCLHLISI